MSLVHIAAVDMQKPLFVRVLSSLLLPLSEGRPVGA
jgi:hypothetical protein